MPLIGQMSKSQKFLPWQGAVVRNATQDSGAWIVVISHNGDAIFASHDYGSKADADTLAMRLQEAWNMSYPALVRG